MKSAKSELKSSVNSNFIFETFELELSPSNEMKLLSNLYSSPRDMIFNGISMIRVLFVRLANLRVFPNSISKSSLKLPSSLK